MLVYSALKPGLLPTVTGFVLSLVHGVAFPTRIMHDSVRHGMSIFVSHMLILLEYSAPWPCDKAIQKRPRFHAHMHKHFCCTYAIHDLDSQSFGYREPHEFWKTRQGGMLHTVDVKTVARLVRAVGERKTCFGTTKPRYVTAGSSIAVIIDSAHIVDSRLDQSSSSSDE